MRLASYLDPLTEIEAMAHYAGNPVFVRSYAGQLESRLIKILTMRNPAARINVVCSRQVSECVMGVLYGYKLFYEVSGSIRGRKYKHGVEIFSLDIKITYAEMVDDFTQRILSKASWH